VEGLLAYQRKLRPDVASFFVSLILSNSNHWQCHLGPLARRRRD
jgi:hypothetical protein